MLDRVQAEDELWDIAIVGGGATGLACAHDAALRGYKVLLVEQSDFAKGTSSRSTKLIHGGVRYLAQGNVSLVREALEERARLMQNAPNLVKPLPFVLPAYHWWEPPFYGIGLWMYDMLAKEIGQRRSRPLTANTIRKQMPGLRERGLIGGTLYFDAQFDDTRLAVALAKTAVQNGATVLNYVRARGFVKENGRITGLELEDKETGLQMRVRAKVTINATGVFADEVRKLDDPDAPAAVRPSQGVHLVLDQKFLKSTFAMLIPRTDDGRVLFAIPWHDHLLVGTTDVPGSEKSLEPVPSLEEVDYLLEHIGRYLTKQPDRSDILSAFAGLRPLVKPPKGAGSTASISRDHSLFLSDSKLLTITGGKWTTCRRMGEDAINRAAEIGGLEIRPCVTENAALLDDQPERDPESKARLHPDLEYEDSDILTAVQSEMALNVEDVLARRTRALFLNAQAAIDLAPGVAAKMAELLDRDAEWQEEQVKRFGKVAQYYLPG